MPKQQMLKKKKSNLLKITFIKKNQQNQQIKKINKSKFSISLFL